MKIGNLAPLVALASCAGLLGFALYACDGGTLPPGTDSGAPPPQDARPVDTTDANAIPCRSIGEPCLSNTECCTSICTSRVVVEAGGGEPTRCSASF